MGDMPDESDPAYLLFLNNLFSNKLDGLLLKTGKIIELITNLVAKHSLQRCQENCLENIPLISELDNLTTQLNLVKGLLALQRQHQELPITVFELGERFFFLNNQVIVKQRLVLASCQWHFTRQELENLFD